MSYTGYGADSMPYYQFTTRADGARLFSDAAQLAVLGMLGTMYVAPQVPAIDSDGTRILLTPGPGMSALPTGYASAVAAARAGQIVLALESFVPTIQQALRFTTADKVADLTADGGQGYVVLLTPESAQSLSPFEPPPAVTPPAQLPPAPPPPPSVPTPGVTPSADTPHPLPGPAPAPGGSGVTPNTAAVVVYGAPFPPLSTKTMLIAGAAVLGVGALIMMSGKKKPAGAKYRGNRRSRRYNDNMSKKDYIKAAQSVAMLPKSQRRKMAESLVALFQADNPRFDRQRFFAACGV